jgi:tetratricopeptide (TPR) repeat protein
MSRRVAFLVIIACLVAAVAGAAETSSPSWLLYEQGKAAMDREEYGEALKLFQEAVKGDGIFPEAEIGIGDVYIEEGELELAIAQYKKAYELRKSFYIPDDQYEVLYKLAGVYEKMELYKLMEEALLLIVKDDAHFAETDTYRIKTQIEKNYAEKGIDRVLYLYSFNDAFAARAHSRLGVFYYRTGRYMPSTSHLLYALVSRAARMKDFLHEKDPEYEFSTLADLVQNVEESTELRQYATETGMFSDLYYLAGSTFANGYVMSAKAIWQLISSSKSAGTYANLAARQVKKPQLEPLLKLEH